MPRLTKEQLKAISYISMADYANKLDQIEDFEDKLEFTARYLLSHGAKGQKTDYSLEEAIHLARAKLVDTSRKLRDKLYNDEEGPDPPIYISIPMKPRSTLMPKTSKKISKISTSWPIPPNS